MPVANVLLVTDLNKSQSTAGAIHRYLVIGLVIAVLALPELLLLVDGLHVSDKMIFPRDFNIALRALVGLRFLMHLLHVLPQLAAGLRHHSTILTLVTLGLLAPLPLPA